MDFAEKLQAVMDARQFTQTDIHALTGISKSAISQYLAGKNKPRAAVIECMEQALGVSLTEDDIPEDDKPFLFSTQPISVNRAARIMHIANHTLADMLERGELPFGFATKRPGSQKRTYYISPKLFYEYTGWRA